VPIVDLQIIAPLGFVNSYIAWSTSMCVTHRRWDGDRSFIRTGLGTIRRLFAHTLKVNPSRAEDRGRQPDRRSASHAQDQTRRQRARNALAKSRRLSLVATSASTSYSAHEIWVIRFIIRPTSTVPKWHGDDNPERKPVVRKYPRRHSTRTGRIVATTNISISHRDSMATYCQAVEYLASGAQLFREGTVDNLE